MFTVLAIVTCVVVVGVAVAAVLLPRGRRVESEPGEDVAWDVEAGDPADFPRPGEPSPRRPDGSPVPGSRDDRRRHGRR